jgi:hypothetical protein
VVGVVSDDDFDQASLEKTAIGTVAGATAFATAAVPEDSAVVS